MVTLTVGGIAGCAAVTGPGHHRATERSAAAAGAALRWGIDGASAVRMPTGTDMQQIAGGINKGWFLGEPGARRVVPLPSAGVLGLTPADGVSRSTSPSDVTAVSALAGSGIPSTALAAYQLAARREVTRLPSCGITWPLLAGIGRVESNHGRFAGATLHTDGVSTPRIIGIPLNGVGTTRIMDTDGGRTDGDPVFDRAVGPMQFIPSTRAGFGVDANHDGRKDPFNVYDAAAAAADYLCAAGRNLRTYAGQVQAVRSYIDSDSYIAMVLQLERVYAAGVGNIRVPVVPTSPDPHHVPPVHPVTLPPVDPGSPRGLPNRPRARVRRPPPHRRIRLPRVRPRRRRPPRPSLPALPGRVPPSPPPPGIRPPPGMGPRRRPRTRGRRANRPRPTAVRARPPTAGRRRPMRHPGPRPSQVREAFG